MYNSFRIEVELIRHRSRTPTESLCIILKELLLNSYRTHSESIQNPFRIHQNSPNSFRIQLDSCQTDLKLTQNPVPETWCFRSTIQYRQNSQDELVPLELTGRISTARTLPKRIHHLLVMFSQDELVPLERYQSITDCSRSTNQYRQNVTKTDGTAPRTQPPNRIRRIRLGMLEPLNPYQNPYIYRCQGNHVSHILYILKMLGRSFPQPGILF